MAALAVMKGPGAYNRFPAIFQRFSWMYDTPLRITTSCSSCAKALKSIFPVLFSLTLKSICLADHILHHNIIDLAYGIAVFQNLLGLIGVKMNLDQIFISGSNQAVALKMLGYVRNASEQYMDNLHPSGQDGGFLPHPRYVKSPGYRLLHGLFVS